jgi:hypothetical protein
VQKGEHEMKKGPFMEALNVTTVYHKYGASEMIN